MKRTLLINWRLVLTEIALLCFAGCFISNALDGDLVVVSWIFAVVLIAVGVLSFVLFYHYAVADEKGLTISYFLLKKESGTWDEISAVTVARGSRTRISLWNSYEITGLSGASTSYMNGELNKTILSEKCIRRYAGEKVSDPYEEEKTRRAARKAARKSRR